MFEALYPQGGLRFLGAIFLHSTPLVQNLIAYLHKAHAPRLEVQEFFESHR